MEEILVNNCGNCPFCHINFDPDSMGFDTIEYCLLAQFKQQDEYIIDVYDSNERSMNDYLYDDNEEVIGVNPEPIEIRPIPVWCSLTNNELNIKHVE